MIAAVVLAVVVAVLVWDRHRDRERMARERAAFARERASMLMDAAWERDRAAQERSGLLQRIQAPEVAVAQAVARERPDGPLYVPVDDDAAYWADQSTVIYQADR